MIRPNIGDSSGLRREEAPAPAGACPGVARKLAGETVDREDQVFLVVPLVPASDYEVL